MSILKRLGGMLLWLFLAYAGFGASWAAVTFLPDAWDMFLVVLTFPVLVCSAGAGLYAAGYLLGHTPGEVIDLAWQLKTIKWKAGRLGRVDPDSERVEAKEGLIMLGRLLAVLALAFVMLCAPTWVGLFPPFGLE